jgi:hypothetical protein
MGAVRLGGRAPGGERRFTNRQAGTTFIRAEPPNLPLDSGLLRRPGPWSARTKGPTRAAYHVSRSRLTGADRRRTGSGERYRFVSRPLVSSPLGAVCLTKTIGSLGTDRRTL